jgi:hypothetical protein
MQYRVEIGSVMDLRWMEYFPVVAYTISKGNEQGHTDMILDVADQAELIGIVNQLHGYGVDLLSVALVQDSPTPTSH